MHQRSHDEETRFAERLKRLRGEQYEKVYTGALVRKMRLRLRFTQKELATKLQTSQSVIARIEKGRQNLTLRMLVKIAGVFGKKVTIHFS